MKRKGEVFCPRCGCKNPNNQCAHCRILPQRFNNSTEFKVTYIPEQRGLILSKGKIGMFISDLDFERARHDQNRSN